MKSYCLKRRKDAKNINPKVSDTKDNDIIKMCNMW